MSYLGTDASCCGMNFFSSMLQVIFTQVLRPYKQFPQQLSFCWLRLLSSCSNFHSLPPKLCLVAGRIVKFTTCLVLTCQSGEWKMRHSVFSFPSMSLFYDTSVLDQVFKKIPPGKRADPSVRKGKEGIHLIPLSNALGYIPYYYYYWEVPINSSDTRWTQLQNYDY